MGFKNTIEIITKDIQELEKIVGNFQNYSRIPKIEIDLALNKMQNLYDLLLMIREHEEEFHPDESPKNIPAENSMNVIETSKPGNASTEVEKEKKEKFEFISSEELPTVAPGNSNPPLIEQPETQKAEKTHEVHEIVSPPTPKEKVLGEKFRSTGEYINEKIGSGKPVKDLSSRIQSSPIRSISGSMGINDKFFFIRELFYGNADNFNQAMKTLDQMTNFNHAYNYLLGNFEWDMDSEPVQQLLTLIRRKFISTGNE